MNAFTGKNLSTQNIEPEHEPIFMQDGSAVSGRVYNDEVVDHLADMLLISTAAAERRWERSRGVMRETSKAGIGRFS